MKYYYAIFTLAIIVIFHILRLEDIELLEWELVGIMGVLMYSLQEIRDEIRKGNQMQEDKE